MYRKLLAFALVLIVVAVCWVEESLAVQAAPIEHTLKQSDGTEFKARQWGDEWLNGWETTDGYSIVFDENTQDWTYAVTGIDGDLVSSFKAVGIDSAPHNIERKLRPSGTALKDVQLLGPQRSIPERVVPPTGIANVPVFMMNFNDTTTTYTPAQFNTLLSVQETGA